MLFAQSHWCGIIPQSASQQAQSGLNMCLEDEPEEIIYYLPTVIHVLSHDNALTDPITEDEIEGVVSSVNDALESYGIELILAKVDPDGGCTTGIEYFIDNDLAFPKIGTFPLADPNSLEPGNTYNWNTTDYFNIILVQDIFTAVNGVVLLPDRVLGYASPPIALAHGIVIDVDHFNTEVAVHEIGHYLGLRHLEGPGTFQGTCEDSCGEGPSDACTTGDFVSDTAPVRPNFSFNVVDCDEIVFPNAMCFNSPCNPSDTFPTEPYPVRNYMGVVQNCFSEFTEKQVSRMNYILNSRERPLWFPGYDIYEERYVELTTEIHKDITIYPGGKLTFDGVEVIMAEGTTINVMEGGKLEVINSSIRGCDISETERGKWNGIFVEGRNPDGYDVEFLTATIEDVDGFVVTALHSGFFALEPPGKIKSYHTNFNNVDGLLHTLSRFPSNNNSIIENCVQNGGQYGVKTFNGLNIEIKESKFFEIEKECVSSIGGSFDIQENEFHGGEVDVALTHFQRGEPSSITNNNEFRGNGYGIRAAGSTRGNHIIESNIFYEVDDSDGSDIDVDIYMDGITDYSILDNVFKGRLGVSSRSTINTSNQDQGRNLVDDNVLDGNRTGLFPHFSNPNYIFSNNCFSTLSRDVSIIGLVPNQGDENGAPANNCFTHQGNPIGNTVPSITGSPDPFDYVDPIENNLDCRMPLLIPGNVNVLFTDEDPFISCFHSDEERASENNFDGLDFTLYDNYSVLNTYISQGDFQAARQQLTQIDKNSVEGSDLHFIATNLIDFYENFEENIEQDHIELVNNLKDIALKNHPSSGFAQAFHYYLTGDFVDNLDLNLLEIDDINERSWDRDVVESKDKNLNFYPNPASNFLMIENANLIQSLNVYNLMGNSILESGETSIISTKEWLSGLYIFKMSLKNGDTLTKKILINK